MNRYSRRAVFLDRDGVLNALVMRDGRGVSPRRREDFRLIAGADEVVGRFRTLRLLVFVVTNQPDVARGHLPQAELDAMSAILAERVPVDEIAVCPHDDADGCDCRKPKPGLLQGLAERWQVDLPGSYAVGDSWRDVEAGRRAGCRTILLGAGRQGDAVPDFTVATLGEAAAAIEGELEAMDERGADGLRP
jgi:D-glycero-D-manno-heptose 1,7-bisphosphate phosphatase